MSHIVVGYAVESVRMIDFAAKYRRRWGHVVEPEREFPAIVGNQDVKRGDARAAQVICSAPADDERGVTCCRERTHAARRVAGVDRNQGLLGWICSFTWVVGIDLIGGDCLGRRRR